MLIDYRKAFPLLDRIQDRTLAEAACGIWDTFFRQCKWPDLEAAMLNIDPAKGTLANYVRAVMQICWDSADTLAAVYSLAVDRDVLLLSAFLHDACKLIEYEPSDDPRGYHKSRLGELYQHGFLSASSALAAGMPEAVVSNIICHTPQTNHKICTVEGHILEHADRMVTSSLALAASPQL